jgi:hypothetical protein
VPSARKEITVQNSQLIALTQDIVKELGNGWTFTPTDDSVYQRIDGEGQAQLYLHLTSNGYSKPADFVVIGGSLNVGKDRQYVRVYERGADGKGWNEAHVSNIKAKIARGAKAIAGDIKRRLLPEYLRVLALAQKQVADEAERVNRVRAVLDRLAPLVNKTTDNLNEEASSLSFYNETQGYGDIKAHSDGTVSLELNNLSEEKARKILELL